LNNVIAINPHTIVKVFLNANELSSTDLKWVLPYDMKLNRYSQLENLLSRSKGSNQDIDQSDQTIEHLIEKSLFHLQKIRGPIKLKF
jgi:hypothetical protein